MLSFVVGIFLVLLSPVFLVGIVFTWRGAKNKAQMSAGVVVVVAFMCLGYVVGRSDGERAYFHRFRTEMNPFLRELRMVSDAKRIEAIDDFLIRAEDVKLQPEDYLKDLKGARPLLSNTPNKALEPTALGRGSP